MLLCLLLNSVSSKYKPKIEKHINVEWCTVTSTTPKLQFTLCTLVVVTVSRKNYPTREGQQLSSARCKCYNGIAGRASSVGKVHCRWINLKVDSLVVSGGIIFIIMSVSVRSVSIFNGDTSLKDPFSIPGGRRKVAHVKEMDGGPGCHIEDIQCCDRLPKFTALPWLHQWWSWSRPQKSQSFNGIQR